MKKLILLCCLVLTSSIGFSQTKNPKTKTGDTTTSKPRVPFRVRFDQVFRTNDNGSISPLGQVQINGVTMGSGVSFGPGVSMGGLDIYTIRGYDLAIDTVKGVILIKGYYKP